MKSPAGHLWSGTSCLKARELRQKLLRWQVLPEAYGEVCLSLEWLEMLGRKDFISDLN